jgi:hypothetical protein
MFSITIQLVARIDGCPAKGLPAVDFRRKAGLPECPDHSEVLELTLTDEQACRAAQHRLDDGADLKLRQRGYPQDTAEVASEVTLRPEHVAALCRARDTKQCLDDGTRAAIAALVVLADQYTAANAVKQEEERRAAAKKMARDSAVIMALGVNGLLRLGGDRELVLNSNGRWSTDYHKGARWVVGVPHGTVPSDHPLYLDIAASAVVVAADAEARSRTAEIPKQIAAARLAIVHKLGSPEQAARAAAGVLPEGELRALVRAVLFAPVEDRAAYSRITASDFDDQTTDEDITCDVNCLGELSAEQWTVLNEVKTALGGQRLGDFTSTVTVEVRRHTCQVKHFEEEVVRDAMHIEARIEEADLTVSRLLAI